MGLSECYPVVALGMTCAMADSRLWAVSTNGVLLGLGRTTINGQPELVGGQSQVLIACTALMIDSRERH